MKKALTPILLVVFIAANALAQTGHTGNLKLAEKYLPAPGNTQKLLLKYMHQRTYTRGGSGWFNYIVGVNNFLGGISSISNTYLFPDSNITAEFGGGSSATFGTPFIHSIATVLDPKSIVFQYPYVPMGTLPQLTANDSYTLDSVEFFYGYFRNYPDTNEVDTLVLTVFDNSPSKGNESNLADFFINGVDALTDFGVDTVKFKEVPYNYLNHSPLPFITGYVQVKIPLDKNYANDTIPGGESLAKISTSALGTIDANSLVTVTASFIPGYNYSLADTLNNMNYVIFSSLNEIPGSYPVYLTGDYNQSFTVTNEDQYNGAGNLDSFYLATDLFSSQYPFNDNNFSFLIDCQTCNNVATGVKPVSATAQSLNVVPNPCFNCEIRGVENVNDLLVTDLLGRTVQVSYNKSSGGYQLNIPNDRTGFFIVRNIRTGEVVKFVRE